MKLLTVHAAHFSLLFLLIIIFGATKHDTRLHKGANERRNATHPQQTHASQMPWIIHTTRKNHHRRRPLPTDDLFTLLWLFVLKQTPGRSLCVHRRTVALLSIQFDGDEATTAAAASALAPVVSPNRNFYFCVCFWCAQCKQGHVTFSRTSSIGSTESDCVEYIDSRCRVMLALRHITMLNPVLLSFGCTRIRYTCSAYDCE